MTSADDDGPSAYQRGEAAGQISARLADHDKHFAAINGNLTRIADLLQETQLELQRLADQATARDVTVINTAAALKAAKDADDQRWSPLTRWGTTVGIVGGVVALIVLLVRAQRGL